MADVVALVKRLGITDRRVVDKASEYVRLSTSRLGVGGLGQGELCKGAACVELACMTLGVTVDAALVGRYSGVGDKVYRNAKAALQKILGVTSKATARDLCIQFGCARHDQSVRATLAAYKERFVRSLPAVQQGHVDFGRPVFLAAAFYMVARKNKVSVDRMKLLGPLGVTATEFGQVCASLADLCHDLVGTEVKKRKAEEVPQEQRNLIERTGAAEDDDVASGSEDEVEDEGQVGYRINHKKQRQREYEAWKQKMTAKPSSAAGGSGAADAAAEAGPSGSGAGGRKKEQLTEKKLRQAVLSFAAPPAAPAAGAPEAAAAAAEGGSGGATGQQAAAAASAPPATESKGKASSSKGKAKTPAKKAPTKKEAQKPAGGKGRTPQRGALASKNT